MSIDPYQNRYRGINAHLHSFLQHEMGGWKVFHNTHVIDLAKALNRQLPAKYEVSPTKSLQIAEFHPDTGERIRRPETDVTITRQLEIVGGAGQAAIAVIEPTLTLEATEMLEEDEALFLTALEIRHVPNNTLPGIPVLRIELLSPTNKIDGDGYIQYREKRSAAIASGVPLLEIDYLHETRFPARKIPDYTSRQAGSYPYLLVLTDPRPHISKTKVYGFHTDTPIPKIELPLAGDETLAFDFDAVYQETYASLRHFSNRVDYTQPPQFFESYAQVDQERILARMHAIATETA